MKNKFISFLLFWKKKKRVEDMTKLEKLYHWLDLLTEWYKSLINCYSPLTEQIIDKHHNEYLKARREYKHWIRQVDKLAADFEKCSDLIDNVLAKIAAEKRNNNE